MEIFFKRRLLACFVWLFFATSVASSASFVGEPAPDFVLPSLQDGNVRLSEYRSEVVVVSFWSSWCNRCRLAMPLYESLYQQHRDSGLNMISISIDGDADVARQMAADFNLNFTMLLDQQHQVSRLYDLGKLPMTLVIDREGNVVFVDKGFRDDSSKKIAAEVAGLLAE